MTADQIDAIQQADILVGIAGLPSYSQLVDIVRTAKPLFGQQMIKLVNELNPYPEALQQKLMKEPTWLNAKAGYDAVADAVKLLGDQ